MQPGRDDPVIRQEKRGRVAVLTLANPPVNALSAALRQGLARTLAEANADPDVDAVVLCGEGRGFSAGADIAEFGKPGQPPRLGDLCKAIEASAKPVVAAIHGMALGGGLELALAAHYRLAGPGAVLGLPEVNLGLVPGAGGTQRLPRILGAKEALRMMMSGVPVNAPDAARLGLIDQLVEGGGLVEAAVAFAATGPVPRPTGQRRDAMADGKAYLAAVAEARASQAGARLPAAGRIVDLVEAALLFPLEQGLVAEATSFADLVARPESAGLRHAFFVERRAQQLPPALAGASVPELGALGIWGGGEAVAELVRQALASGLRVILADENREALVALARRIAAGQEADVAAGRLTPEARDADWARLETNPDPQALAGAGLVLVAGSGLVTGAEGAALVRSGLRLATLGAAGPASPAAITPAGGRSGLAELGLTQGAKAEVALALVALARRLNWRLVPVGPGGPVELGLRLALGAAVAHLAGLGISATQVGEALGRWLRPRLSPPVAGLDEADERLIVETCLLAMAAEGARMVEDGRAPRPATVDAVALLSGLMPRWEGGPLFWADRRGLLVLRHDLRALAGVDPVFVPSALLDRLIADGKGLASLNETRG